MKSSRPPVFPLDGDAAADLLAWYEAHGAAYPWAADVGTWGIWVSEVMLQQTTVAAVAPRYTAWMEKYPDPEALAAADEQQVLRDWEGLGYYSRARNLAAAARAVRDEYGGRIPEDRRTLKGLPGVGDYIASAVASFAFGERTLALDANGRRIASRLTASETWDSSLEKAFRARAEELMPAGNPGAFNAALMQLGQRICTPRNPDCPACPLRSGCRAAAEGRQEEIPPRRRQEVIRKKTYLSLKLENGRVLMRRKESGIGKGLWVFPAARDDEGPWRHVGTLPEAIHAYTRYRETLVPEIRLPADGIGPVSGEKEDGEWIPLEDLPRRPMPTAYRRISEQLTEFVSSKKGIAADSLVPYGVKK